MAALDSQIGGDAVFIVLHPDAQLLQRLDHFNRAVRQLPNDLPINVILFAMEGDPAAAPAFWVLALRTGGSMLAPSEDWP